MSRQTPELSDYLCNVGVAIFMSTVVFIAVAVVARGIQNAQEPPTRTPFVHNNDPSRTEWCGFSDTDINHLTVGDRCVYCTGQLCIGSIEASYNYAALDDAGVTHVVSTLGRCSSRFDERPCLNLRLLDTITEYEIVSALLEASKWRNAQRTPNMRVFVHCAAGISRSSTVVLYYMMEDNPALTYDVALQLLRVVRPVAKPNPLFELALRLIEKIGASDDAQRALTTDPLACSHDIVITSKACEAMRQLWDEHGELLPFIRRFDVVSQQDCV